MRPEGWAPDRVRLPSSSRITRARDIRWVLRKGKQKKTSHLDVFFLSREGLESRFGLIVPKHRHRVVDRNLLKRRLREIGRREVIPGLRERGQSLDILVRARREAYGAGYQELRKELVDLVKKLW